MKNNILFYIPKINKTYGGVYQYSIGLLKTLSKDLSHKYNFHVYILEKNEEYRFLAKEHKNIFLIETLPSEPLTLKFSRFFKSFTNKILSQFNINIYFKLTVPHIDYIIKKRKINIIHCPYQEICKDSHNTPIISTMHDVQELYFPEFFSSKEREDRSRNYRKCIDKSDIVIVSYNHIKNDIIRFFEKPSSKVKVLLLEMQNLWFHKFNNSDLIKPDDVSEFFILYPASTWKHKNHLKLLEALEIIINKHNIDLKLVCTGNNNTPHFHEINKKVEELRISNNVKFLGIVDDKDLYNLYKRARAIVIPTLYEAGSFPLMESILMKIPVICSNVTSLPETIGDIRFTFDPNNKEDISSKIIKIVTDINFRKENINAIESASKELRNTEISNNVSIIYNNLIK